MRFLHALALPADALAQQRDDLDRDLRLALEEAEKVLAPQHEQFAGFAGGRIRQAALAVQHRDLAEQVARPHEVQGQTACRRRRRSRYGSGPGARRTARPPHRPSGTAPRHSPRCWVWQSSDSRWSSSAPRSANIGFIFRMTANSACLLISMSWRISLASFLANRLANQREQDRVIPRRGSEAISHITLAASPRLFLRAWSRLPRPGDKLRRKGRMR